MQEKQKEILKIINSYFSSYQMGCYDVIITYDEFLNNKNIICKLATDYRLKRIEIGEQREEIRFIFYDKIDAFNFKCFIKFETRE